MKIQETISGIQSFSGLLPLALDAEIKVSFWGGLYISVSGYEGTLDVDALAGRVIELWRQNRYEFTEIERSSGRLLAKRIDCIYENIKRHSDDMNCVLKAFAVLVVCISYLFYENKSNYVLWRWAQGPLQLPNDDFEYYTQTQLRTTFGITSEEAERRGFFSNHVDGIHRWHLPIPQ